MKTKTITGSEKRYYLDQFSNFRRKRSTREIGHCVPGKVWTRYSETRFSRQGSFVAVWVRPTRSAGIPSLEWPSSTVCTSSPSLIPSLHAPRFCRRTAPAVAEHWASEEQLRLRCTPCDCGRAGRRLGWVRCLWQGTFRSRSTCSRTSTRRRLPRHRGSCTRGWRWSCSLDSGSGIDSIVYLHQAWLKRKFRTIVFSKKKIKSSEIYWEKFEIFLNFQISLSISFSLTGWLKFGSKFQMNVSAPVPKL